MKDRIKKVRTDNSLTLEEFGARIGTQRSTISCYEHGTRTPSLAVLTAISREFNVRLQWLQTGEGEMMDPILSDPTPAFLETTYTNLPERLKDLARALAMMDRDWYKKLDRGLAEIERMKAAGLFPPLPDDPDK